MLSPEPVDHGSAVWPPVPPPLPGTVPDPSQDRNRTQKTRKSQKSRNWYHTEYSVPVEQFRELPYTGEEEEEEEEPAETQEQPSSDPTAPLIRRRGAWVDYRDVILAHQAHKLHNTPKARRKQWE